MSAELEKICTGMRNLPVLRLTPSPDPAVIKAVSELRYTMRFSGTPDFKNYKEHVCTGYLPNWNFEKAHILNAARFWNYNRSTGRDDSNWLLSEVTEEFCSGILEYTPEYIATNWAGRSGTAELELLTGLLPLRNPLKFLECNHEHKHRVPIELVVRIDVGGYISGGPYRSYNPDYSVYKHLGTPAGWCMWYLARKAGIQFPDYLWYGSGLPYAGIVLHESLLARFNKEDIDTCIQAYTETYKRVGTPYTRRAQTIIDRVTEVLQKYINDGYTTPPAEPQRLTSQSYS